MLATIMMQRMQVRLVPILTYNTFGNKKRIYQFFTYRNSKVAGRGIDNRSFAVDNLCDLDADIFYFWKKKMYLLFSYLKKC